MKKIIILHTVMILLIFQLRAQTKNDYLLKSKNQKTAAWILLGTGATLTFIASYKIIYGLSEIGNGQHHNKIGTGLSLGLIGGLAALGSIPLFIASAKNKRTSISMTFSGQPIPLLIQHSAGGTFIPSINLKIGL
jgi:hypothetical protein